MHERIGAENKNRLNQPFSPSVEAKLVSLQRFCGPTGKSSARERMTLLLDMDDDGHCGLPAGDGEARGEERGG